MGDGGILIRVVALEMEISRNFEKIPKLVILTHVGDWLELGPKKWWWCVKEDFTFIFSLFVKVKDQECFF